MIRAAWAASPDTVADSSGESGRTVGAQRRSWALDRCMAYSLETPDVPHLGPCPALSAPALGLIRRPAIPIADPARAVQNPGYCLPTISGSRNQGPRSAALTTPNKKRPFLPNAYTEKPLYGVPQELVIISPIITLNANRISNGGPP